MRRFVVVLCLLALFCTSPALARTWTSRNGRTTTGKFVRLHNGNVVLMRGGRVITIPFQNFCDADQAYIREKAGLPADLGAGSRPGGRNDSESPTKPRLPKFNEGPGYGAKDDGSSPGGSSGEEGGETSSDEPTIADLDLGFIEERTWTDSEGRQIRAKLVPQEETSDEVTLLKDGKTFKVSRNRLSSEDIAYLEEMRERIEQARREAANKGGGLGGGSTAAGSDQPEKRSPFPTWKPPGYGSNNGVESSSTPSTADQTMPNPPEEPKPVEAMPPPQPTSSPTFSTTPYETQSRPRETSVPSKRKKFNWGSVGRSAVRGGFGGAIIGGLIGLLRYFIKRSGS